MHKSINTKGIGIDIIESSRFKKFLNDKQHQFIKKVFTKCEIKYCFNYRDPLPHLAGIFAAKEAVSKAMGASKNFLANIEIRHNKEGIPEAWQKNKKIKSISVSITHTNSVALAIAIKR